jgi:hypothetical protein
MGVENTMLGIKINNADKWFSKCARLRTHYTCEYCGVVYNESSQGLHASHYFGRKSYSTRYDPDNIFAHCFSCHQFLGGNPEIFRDWAHKQLGSGRIQILRERNRDITVGRIVKKNLPEVEKHYKMQYENMLKLKAQGVITRLEFVNFI